MADAIHNERTREAQFGFECQEFVGGEESFNKKNNIGLLEVDKVHKKLNCYQVPEPAAVPS